MHAVRVFLAIATIRRFEQSRLPVNLTLVDLAIIHEIGFHQQDGALVTLKTLHRAAIGSPATVQRCISKLKRLGVIVDVKAHADRRLTSLTLSPAVIKLYRSCDTALQRVLPGIRSARRIRR